MEEKVFYKSKTITVTNARLVVRDCTYPINNITRIWIKGLEKPPLVGIGLFGCAFVALGLHTPGLESFSIVGAFFIIAALVYGITQRNNCKLLIYTSSSLRRAQVITGNRSSIKILAEALNQALVYDQPAKS